MTRLLPLCILASACVHDPQINHDIAMTTIGAAITAAGLFVAHAQYQEEDPGPGDALGALLTLGGGILTIVEAALLYTDVVHGPPQ